MNIQALEVGHIYEFKIEDWLTPFDELIRGEKKRRIFIGHVERDGIQFIEVQRETGKKHLIAVETIESVKAVTKFS